MFSGIREPLLRPRWFDELPSTNTWLLERLRARAPGAPAAGTVIAARRQTAGRGRRGRTWRTSPGRDLAASLVLPAPADPREVGALAMALALGVAEWAESLGATVAVKWPNDVLAAPRGRRKGCSADANEGGWGKLAGVLVEQAGAFLVAGVGVNLAADGAAAAPETPVARSLEAALPSGVRAPEPEAALEGLCAPEVWPVLIGRWRSGGFDALRDAWMARSAGLGERLPGRAETLEGFGAFGAARVRAPDGRTGELWQP